MTQVTGRWKNQYAYEARREKVAGLSLGKSIKTFSTNKYGDEQARLMATAQRRAWEREITINPPSTKGFKNG